MTTTDTRRIFEATLASARETLDLLTPLGGPVDRAARLIHAALGNSHKLLACGNGGSACDSAHFCGELVGRFIRERRGYPAIDLTADHGVLTALINDYPPERLFARQVEALGQPGDVLAVFTTSGKSPNIIKALEAGRAGGLKTIAFLGRDGGDCKGLADVELLVPSKVTARVQEAHAVLYHTICEILDEWLK